MSYRPDFWPENKDLLIICNDVHAATTGSSDLDPDTLKLYLQCLKWWINHIHQTPQHFTEWELLLSLIVRQTIIDASRKFEKIKCYNCNGSGRDSVPYGDKCEDCND